MSFLQRPQATWARRALFQVHLWTGVAVAAYVCLIGVTGAALVFRGEMQKATFKDSFPLLAVTGVIMWWRRVVGA